MSKPEPRVIQRPPPPGLEAGVDEAMIRALVHGFYDRIRAEDPPGASLQSLLTGPDQVVIGHRLAQQLGTHVGDTLRVGSAKNLQTVKGIVPDKSGLQRM